MPTHNPTHHLLKWQKRETYLREELVRLTNRIAADQKRRDEYERAHSEARSRVDMWTRRSSKMEPNGQ